MAKLSPDRLLPKRCILVIAMLENNKTKNIIYIYAGAGTSRSCLKYTKNAIAPFLETSQCIQYICAKRIVHDYWEKETALLIIPGGADIPYTEALNGVGNQKIKNYVKKGGSFLGICAGGYYAGTVVDFAKATQLEVQAQRELGFFPGTIKGPVLAPYNYHNESGARAAKIRWHDPAGFPLKSSFTLYYNGGGYFVDAHKKPDVSILAYYAMPKKCAALVECRIGKGKAILSGVHFEHDPFHLDQNNEFLKPLIPYLIKKNHQRQQLIAHLLQRLKQNA